MYRTPVASSNLASVGYDPDLQILEIEFRNGTVYQYAEVSPALVRGLMTAPSLGRFFVTSIRGANFPYRRLR